MKICIVGGGSAGWMTASTLIKAYPNWDITLFESDNIPTVGVGESTTQYFRLWLHFLGLKDKEWMAACDATYKLSVRFHNFHEIGDTPWQYPFGLPRGFATPDSWFFNAWKNNWSNDKFARDYYLAAACGHANKLPENDQYFPFERDTGFHFDAVKFANWIRDNYAIPRGVKHIIETVDKSILNEDYDLFFDCTGWKSMLNDSEWIDYDYLPNDRAWVTRKKYTTHIEKEMVPVTDCTALSSGWVWRVPTWSRVGTGYNFSSKYQTEKEALHEFARHIKTDIDDGFRMISYKTGRKKEIWNGNVISMGLSAGFIEPLESNGLLSVHQNLLFFVKTMGDRENVTQYMRDTFNLEAGDGFDTFSSFVALHYSLTQRNDSPYWRAVSNIKYPQIGLLERCQRLFMAPSTSYVDGITFGQLDGLLAVMAGHGWNPFDNVTMDEIEFHGGVPRDAPANNIDIPDWDWYLDSLPTPYEYYKLSLIHI